MAVLDDAVIASTNKQLLVVCVVMLCCLFVVRQLTLKAPTAAPAQTPATLACSAPAETVSQPPSTAQIDLLGLGRNS